MLIKNSCHTVCIYSAINTHPQSGHSHCPRCCHPAITVTGIPTLLPYHIYPVSTQPEPFLWHQRSQLSSVTTFQRPPLSQSPSPPKALKGYKTGPFHFSPACLFCSGYTKLSVRSPPHPTRPRTFNIPVWLFLLLATHSLNPCFSVRQCLIDSLLTSPAPNHVPHPCHLTGLFRYFTHLQLLLSHVPPDGQPLVRTALSSSDTERALCKHC